MTELFLGHALSQTSDLEMQFIVEQVRRDLPKEMHLGVHTSRNKGQSSRLHLEVQAAAQKATPHSGSLID
jgi:hypothetical protein